MMMMKCFLLCGSVFSPFCLMNPFFAKVFAALVKRLVSCSVKREVVPSFSACARKNFLNVAESYQASSPAAREEF